MELKWLEDFVALAGLRSFSKAADERNVTQPAFSRRIRAIEEWFGVELVDRSTTPITLTAAGEDFLPHARRLIASTEAMRHDIRLRHGAKRSTIRIITSHHFATTVAPRVVASFSRERPTSHISVVPSLQQYREMGDHSDALMSGAADILLTYDHGAFVLPDIGNDQIDRLVFQEETIVPVAVPGYADALGADWADSKELSLSFVGYPKYSFTEKIVEPILERFGSRLDKVYESPVTASVRAATLRGIGLAWLPLNVVDEDIRSNRLVRLHGDDLTARISIVFFRRKNVRNPLLEDFWRHIERMCAPPCDQPTAPATP